MGPPGRRNRRGKPPQATAGQDEHDDDQIPPDAPEAASGNLRAYLLPPSSLTSSSSALPASSPHPEPGPSRITASISHSSLGPESPGSPGKSAFPRPQTTSDDDTPVEPHIPRAPNAFILFRSHLIRTGAIPKSVEGKNKDLSKIIGAVWQGLSPDERAHWEREAQEALRLHRLRYPDWRFAPGIQLGEAPVTKRRKRKADAIDSEVAGKRKSRRVKAKEPFTVSPADEDTGKGKQKMKEEDPGETSPSSVIYAPTLPVPYSFSIPLRPSPGPSRPILPIPTRAAVKAASLPMVNPLPAPTPQHSRRHLTFEDSPPPSPHQLAEPRAPIAPAPLEAGPSTQPEQHNQPYECHWTGHELEMDREASPAPYLPASHSSPRVSQPHHSPYNAYFPPATQHSHPSPGPGYVHDTFYSYSPPTHENTAFLPPAMLSPPYDPTTYTQMPSPLGDAADFTSGSSESQVVQHHHHHHHHFRRGSFDQHTRSPLSQSHAFDAFIGDGGSGAGGSGSSAMPVDQPIPSGSSWQSFGQMYPSTWSDPQPSASTSMPSPQRVDPTYGGAVSGGVPLQSDFGGGASPPGYPSFPRPHAYRGASSSSELSHALDDPTPPLPHQPHRRNTSEGS